LQGRFSHIKKKNEEEKLTPLGPEILIYFILFGCFFQPNQIKRFDGPEKIFQK
jgi:hypothetical protein